MKYVLLLFLLCFSLNAQTITVSQTAYELVGEEIKEDPNTYLHIFIQEAGRRGHDFSNVQGVFRFTNTGHIGLSLRPASCRGEYEIELQDLYWNSTLVGELSSVYANKFEQRRDLVFHELGHALLRLDHVCHDFSGEFPEAFRHYERHPGFELVTRDIMWVANSCVLQQPTWAGGARSIQAIPTSWEVRLDRMFDPIYQVAQTYECTGLN